MFFRSSPEKSFVVILSQFDNDRSRDKLERKLSRLFKVDRAEPVVPQIEASLGRQLSENERFKVQLIYKEISLAKSPAASSLRDDLR